MSKVEVNQISSQCGSTLTIGQSGDTVTLAAGATQSGFGRTGTVDWDTTAKTASFTAVSGNGYFVNTTSGAITVTLPAGSAGDIVSLADYTNTWQTNSVTITPNGTDKIGGTNADAVLVTEGQSVTFVYVDATEGWKNVQDSTSNVIGNPFLVATGGTVTTCGDYKIHTFTSPGTFTVTQTSSTCAQNTVGYQVVAGGGGGAEGGGGAGGFREGRNVPVDNFTASPLVADAPTNAVTVTATSYPITVGAGGAVNTTGSNSVFSTITSAGGGEGGNGSGGDPGTNGGSGGGGAGLCSPSTNPTGGGSGGTGNTPPVSPSQGNNGGAGGSGFYFVGGGGGGAGATGLSGTSSAAPGPTSGGNGGNGVSSSITGSPVTRGGGGGGKRWTNVSGTPGQGGTGGGGDSGGVGTPGTAGTANTGGGGGANSSYCGPQPQGSAAAGGSGIVIIRYKYQ